MDLVRKLACESDDTQIARILNKQRRRGGSGNPFTQEAVRCIRRDHDIPKCPRSPSRDPHEGPFTADEAVAQLGVAMSTVHRWLRDGVLAGTQATTGAPWRIVLTDECTWRSRLATPSSASCCSRRPSSTPTATSSPTPAGRPGVSLAGKLTLMGALFAF